MLQSRPLRALFFSYGCRHAFAFDDYARHFSRHADDATLFGYATPSMPYYTPRLRVASACRACACRQSSPNFSLADFQDYCHTPFRHYCLRRYFDTLIAAAMQRAQHAAARSRAKMPLDAPLMRVRKCCARAMFLRFFESAVYAPRDYALSLHDAAATLLCRFHCAAAATPPYAMPLSSCCF